MLNKRKDPEFLAAYNVIKWSCVLQAMAYQAATRTSTPSPPRIQTGQGKPAGEIGCQEPAHHPLLMPMGGQPLSEQTQRRGGMTGRWERDWEEKREERLGLECKTN